MDFEDLVTALAPPPNRAGKSDGPHEHHLYEGAVMLAYACRSNKWLAYPIGLLNSLMIASTVLLGWHYLVDVPAGIALALASLYLAEKTHHRLCR